MEKIYNDAKDEHVAKYVMFEDSGYLFVDSDKEVKASAEEVKDAFIKGMVIDVSGDLFVPISISHTDGNKRNSVAYETVTFVKADTSTATTAVLATARSTNE